MIIYTQGIGKVIKQRTISEIIIHCSGSDRTEDDDIEVIREWHLRRRFKDVGYHFFIKHDGTIQPGRPVEAKGAHCCGHNTESIGISFSGDTQFTDVQFQSGWLLIDKLQEDHGIPKKRIFPHSHYNPYKTCPNFALDQIWKFELPF